MEAAAGSVIVVCCSSEAFDTRAEITSTAVPRRSAGRKREDRDNFGSGRSVHLRRPCQGPIIEKMHPWHDVDPGPDAPAILRAIVEIPRGSKVKYELDK